MNAYAGKTHEKLYSPSTAAKVAQAFVDRRADATAQRMLQADLNASRSAQVLQAISQMQGAGTAQLELKPGPGDTSTDVTLIADCMPNFLTGVIADDADYFYRLTGSESGPWNDTDYFYLAADGTLVQATVAMVNAYWDPKYEGFAKDGAPDLRWNCEEYAKAGGFGAEKGEYAKADTARLGELLSANGNYVVKLSYHWLRVEKTGEDAFTIRQKDGESAVYSKSFTKEAAIAYICGKTPDNGKVYGG